MQNGVKLFSRDFFTEHQRANSRGDGHTQEPDEWQKAFKKGQIWIDEEGREGAGAEEGDGADEGEAAAWPFRKHFFRPREKIFYCRNFLNWYLSSLTLTSTHWETEISWKIFFCVWRILTFVCSSLSCCCCCTYKGRYRRSNCPHAFCNKTDLSEI